MRIGLTISCIAFGLAGAGFLSKTAMADPVSVFYRGKSVILIVGTGVGGGYDLYARTLARHIGKHIPGTPNVVVQNMEGAGGIRALNYLARIAPKDGTVFQATYGGLSIRPLIDPAGVEFDPRTLRWIGSSGTQVNICVTWGDSPVKTLEDAMKREVMAAATGSSTNIATMPNLLNRLTGTKFKIILGYSSTSMRIALENGEAESICGLAYSVWIVSNPDWFSKRKLNVLAQFGLEKIKELPDVPLAVDFVASPQDKAVFTLIDVVQRMGQPYVAPPGIREDRLEALRNAFDQTMTDPEFLEESTRMNQAVDPLKGSEMEQLISGAYTLPVSVAARYAELMSEVPAPEKKN